ncbi:MAG: ribosome biogenesis GTPase Der [Enterobacterales bacterium]
MKPIISLIGRQNVGKSTLFNRLTRNNDAIVSNFPGLTIDRKYGVAIWKNFNFIVIDTYGIDQFISENNKNNNIHQSCLAIEESNIIFFIVNGKDGIVPIDIDISNYLRLKNKNTILIVNKVDTKNIYNEIGEFYKLKISNKIFPIIASNGKGINALLNYVFLSKFFKKLHIKDVNKNNQIFNNLNILKYEKKIKNSNIIISIIGKPNVGKSSILNRIVGTNRMVVNKNPGTTRDKISVSIVFNNNQYVFIDTAGIRRNKSILNNIEKYSINKTINAIENSNISLLIINAKEMVSKFDLSLLNLIIKKGKSVIVIVNKCDLIRSRKILNDIKDILNKKLNLIKLNKIHFISALYSNINNIENIFKSIDLINKHANFKVNTSILTKIMHKAIKHNQPPLICGKRIKPKYAHLGGHNPTVIVIHGNKVQSLNNIYKRYLVKYFRNFLNIKGTPILIKCINNNNPFLN